MSGLHRPPVLYHAPDSSLPRADGPDAEYQRTVKELVDGQNQPGYMFGAGAFDKTDLLFIRDHQLQQQQKEDSVADAETHEFAALRAQHDHEVADGAAAVAAHPAPHVRLAPPKRDRADSHKATTQRQLLPTVVVIKRQRTSDSMDEHLATLGPLSTRSVGTLSRGASGGGASCGSLSPVTNGGISEGGLPGLVGYGSSSDDDDDTKPVSSSVGAPGAPCSGVGAAHSEEAGGTGVKAGQAGRTGPSAAAEKGWSLSGVGLTRRVGSAGSGAGLKLPDAALLLGVTVAPQNSTAEAASVPEPASAISGANESSSDSE